VPVFDAQAFLDSAGVSRKVIQFKRAEGIYAQGDAASSVMYLQSGGVKLTVINEVGKEAVVAILGPGDFEDRTGHLPQLLHDVIVRLRLDAGTKAPISKAAAHHGDLRRKQGYTVAMAVQESRLLQVTIFATLHKNTNNLEFSKLLPDVVTIADEVDAQLKEQMLRFMAADAAKLAKGK
jgi:CRP-like cAMP-binding protein